MASTVLGIRELVDYIKALPKGFSLAVAKAHLATLTMAEGFAKKNSTKQFLGRNNRRLSGKLLNSIYSGVEANGEGFVGVRNIPYGAIHEFGGKIVPVKANYLWIPQRPAVGRMTPREFIKLKKDRPSLFFLSPKESPKGARVAGVWSSEKGNTARTLTPLFFLTKEVNMPARPYVGPGIEQALPLYPGYLEKFLREEA